MFQMLHPTDHSHVAECVAEENDIAALTDRLTVGGLLDLVFVLVERMNQFLAEGKEISLGIVSNEVRDDVCRLSLATEFRNLLLEKDFDHVAQTRGEDQHGDLLSEEFGEERSHAFAKFQLRLMNEISHHCLVQRRVQQQRLSLVPPLDHQRRFLLLRQRGIVFDRMILRAELFGLSTN